MPSIYGLVVCLTIFVHKYFNSVGGGAGEEMSKEVKIKVLEERIQSNGEKLRIIFTTVKPENLKQGTSTNNSTARNFMASQNLGPNYHAGHIIANIFGGSGSDVNNLVPMPREFNCGPYKSFENDVMHFFQTSLRTCHEGELKVEITVSIFYKPNSKVPYKIKYDAVAFVKDKKGNSYIGLLKLE